MLPLLLAVMVAYMTAEGYSVSIFDSILSAKGLITMLNPTPHPHPNANSNPNLNPNQASSRCSSSKTHTRGTARRAM